MDPTLLHKQLKENATDLDEFYKDLGNWRKDMADKDKATSKHVLPSVSILREANLPNALHALGQRIRNKREQKKNLRS